jgi:phage terminase large subunit GpA-like protein
MTRSPLEWRLTNGAFGAWNGLAEDDFRPRLKRSPSQWASEVRIMPVGGPISGSQTVRWENQFMSHAVEQMDSADDPNVRMVVIWEGVRDGKTASCLNVMGRTVTDDPGGIFSVHPTDDDVAKFSNDDVEPMIELCLSEYFVEKKSRDSGRTINYKKFKGGSIRIVNAGSITKFRGSTVKVLCIHEADGYASKESIYKAINRTQGLSDAIIFIESTGTIAPTVKDDGTLIYNSVIHEFYDQGDQRKWFCKCPTCRAMQWLKYAQIQARDGDKRRAAYYCEHCDEGYGEAGWRRMAASGIWYPTAGLSLDDQKEIEKSYRDAQPKQPEVRSYWRNGFNSLLPKGKGYATKLHQFLAEGEAAKSSVESLKTWTNEIAAELWNPAAEGEPPPEWKPVFDRREDYATERGKIIVPKGALVITVGVDVHKNRLEVDWGAYGRREEYWGLLHNVLPGEVQDDEVWKELEKELRREFQHELGAKIGLSLGLVDAGKWPEWIYRFLHLLRAKGSPVAGKIRACRGSAQFPHPLIDQRYKSIAKQLKGHWIGGDEAKDLIYSRLRLEPEEDGSLPDGWRHYPKSYDQVHFEQLTSERVTIEYIRGEEVRRYKNEDKSRNEALDCEVYGLAAFRLRRWNFDAIEAELTQRAEPEAQPKKIVKKRNDSGYWNWR